MTKIIGDDGKMDFIPESGVTFNLVPLPFEIKQLQDQEYMLLQQPDPDEAELLAFAELEHPVKKDKEQAKKIRKEQKKLWDKHVADEIAKGNSDPGDMPEYGGMAD